MRKYLYTTLLLALLTQAGAMDTRKMKEKNGGIFRKNKGYILY